jgi:hypothetical protein
MAAAAVSSPKTSPQRPEGLVGADDETGPLVAGGDKLEEQVGGLALQRDVADLIELGDIGIGRHDEL